MEVHGWPPQDARALANAARPGSDRQRHPDVRAHHTHPDLDPSERDIPRPDQGMAVVAQPGRPNRARLHGPGLLGAHRPDLRSRCPHARRLRFHGSGCPRAVRRRASCNPYGLFGHPPSPHSIPGRAHDGGTLPRGRRSARGDPQSHALGFGATQPDLLGHGARSKKSKSVGRPPYEGQGYLGRPWSHHPQSQKFGRASDPGTVRRPDGHQDRGAHGCTEETVGG